MLPESGNSNPASILKAVVFPDPEVPSIPKIEPSHISILKLERTDSAPYDLDRLLALKIRLSNTIMLLNSLYLIYK